MKLKNKPQKDLANESSILTFPQKSPKESIHPDSIPVFVPSLLPSSLAATVQNRIRPKAESSRRRKVSRRQTRKKKEENKGGIGIH
jgi:hypothetical protein